MNQFIKNFIFQKKTRKAKRNSQRKNTWKDFRARVQKSPNAKKKKSIENESLSDCEIIEQVTPIIVLDDEDDVNNENTEIVQAEQSCIVCEDTIVNNESNSDELAKSNVEDEPLFFEDKNPCAEFKTPIYQVKQASLVCDLKKKKLTTKTVPKSKQIEVVVPSTSVVEDSHINNLLNEMPFQPNPALSSTRMEQLNDSLDADNSVVLLNQSADSSVENGSGECTGTSSTNRIEIMSVGSIDHNENSTIKRKTSSIMLNGEPVEKRPKDVVVIDDTVSDDEDSVVFVSETIQFKRPNLHIRAQNQKNQVKFSCPMNCL